MTESHSVSLRVLRLQKPQFHSDRLNLEIPLSDDLILPTSFGTCHLGSTFSALILASNDHSESLSNVKLDVHLQTPSQNAQGLAQAVEANLEFTKTVQTVITFEVKEAGGHALVCAVSYTTATGEQKSLRKLFKFVTTQPLAVKTKVVSPRLPGIEHTGIQRDTTYLEVQVTNISGNPISFERMQLEPAADLEVVDANPEDCLDALDNGDIRQYLFIVKPLEARSPAIAKAQKSGLLTLGRLDISWTSLYGETGRLQTAQLNRRLAGRLPTPSLIPSDPLRFDLIVKQQPGRSVAPFEEFTVVYSLEVSIAPEVKLATDHPVDLVVQHVRYDSSVEAIRAALSSATQSPRSDAGEAATYLAPLPLRVSSSHGVDHSNQPSSSQMLTYCGPSLVHLPHFVLQADVEQSRVHQFEFSMRYSASRSGLVNVGGLRIFHHHQRVFELEEAVLQIHVS